MRSFFIITVLTLLLLNSCKQDDATDLTADFTYEPKVIFVGDTVYFDASLGSKDDSFLYNWDFNNDGVYEVENSKNFIQTHIFDSAAAYIVKLKIDAGNNTFATCVKQITVSEKSDMLSAKIGSDVFVADEFDVIILSSSTILKALRLSDSSYIEMKHLGKYQTGTFALLNGSYYDGQNIMGINDGEISITKFDSVNQIIEGSFELEVDAISGGSIYIKEGVFYKEW